MVNIVPPTREIDREFPKMLYLEGLAYDEEQNGTKGRIVHSPAEEAQARSEGFTEAVAREPEPDEPEEVQDPYPALSPAQEKALDRDGDGRPGGRKKGKAKSRS